MAKFIGKWRGDSKDNKNYDAYAKASGYPADLIEKWRDAVYEIEYKKNGDKWQFSFNSTVGEESMQKNYEFESGKEVTSTDTFGKGLTYNITVESDTKMTEVEKLELMGWKPIKVTREIQSDGTMLMTAELECGTQMTSVMKRVK